MAQWDKDCHEVIVWIRKNRNKFKMEIFDPPALSVNVPDVRFANAVESCFSANQLRVRFIETVLLRNTDSICSAS